MSIRYTIEYNMKYRVFGILFYFELVCMMTLSIIGLYPAHKAYDKKYTQQWNVASYYPIADNLKIEHTTSLFGRNVIKIVNHTSSEFYFDSLF